jgi:hypothetical protein
MQAQQPLQQQQQQQQQPYVAALITLLFPLGGLPIGIKANKSIIITTRQRQTTWKNCEFFF